MKMSTNCEELTLPAPKNSEETSHIYKIPNEIWLTILNSLTVQDIKNFSLTSRRFYEIGCINEIFQLSINNFVISENDYLQAILKSKRKFKDISINNISYLNDHYQAVEKIFDTYGHQVHTLELNTVRLNKFLVQNLLRKLPNLTRLTMIYVDHLVTNNIEVVENNDPMPFPLLTYLQVYFCDIRIEKIIHSFTYGKVQEAKFGSPKTLTLTNFLIKHEKTLTSLSITNPGKRVSDPLASLNELKLKTFEINCNVYVVDEKFQEFLAKQGSLEVLRIKGITVNDVTWEIICRSLLNLKILDCDLGILRNYSHLSNLSQLRELSFINANGIMGNTAMDFNRNENLILLKAAFVDSTPECFRLLSTKAPNLRTFHANIRSEGGILGILRNFKNLEHLKIILAPPMTVLSNSIFNADGQMLLKLKSLHITNPFDIDKKAAKKLVINFPNLEKLIFEFSSSIDDKCAKIVLKGLKKLRVLKLQKCSKKLTKKVIQYFKAYGKNLESVLVEANFDDDYVREILKNRKGLKIAGYNFRIVI